MGGRRQGPPRSGAGGGVGLDWAPRTGEGCLWLRLGAGEAGAVAEESGP